MVTKSSVKIKTALVWAVMSIATAAGIVWTTGSQDAWAEGGSASTDGGGGASTSPCTSGTCYSYARGGGWVKYTPAEMSDVINISGEFGISGGTLEYCKSIGATEYYVLAPALFNSSGYVRQFGMMTVNEFKADGWTFRSNLAGDDLGWKTMKDLFKDAKKAAKHAGKPIEQSFGQTSAFCYNPEWGDDPCIEGTGDPDCPPECTDPECEEQSGSTEFYSTSTVEVFDPDITGGKKETSDPDGKVAVYFSTDKTHVEVEFSHMVGYKHGDFKYLKAGDVAVGSTVTTKWEVTDAYDVPRTDWGAIAPNADNTTWPESAKKKVSFDWGEDEYGEKKKCSKITYTRKGVTLKGEPIIKCDLLSCWVDHYEWSATYSGTGSSEACAVVTRPKPSEGDPGPTTPEGGVTSKIMFAGETTELRWLGLKAKGVPTRRLKDAESIKFLLDEIPGYDASKLARVPTTKFDPCEVYRQRFGGNFKDCKEHDHEIFNTEEQTDKAGFEYPYDVQANFKVVDEVGYKYCNSYGYSFEYWYGVLKGDDEDEIVWEHDTPKDYWDVFHASCRGVAKKPSLAVWNGSLLAGGSIVTSLARRHNAIAFGDLADGNTTLYGSWAEYLIATNAALDSNRTMGSASSLSNGSGISQLCSGDVLATNSAMTIANANLGSTTCNLQPSGIRSNSTFRTRLNAYLRDVVGNPDIKKTSNVNDLYGGLTGNTVLTVSGNLTITQDIVINEIAGGYTIHDVPQAVIFVTGNVNITENVQRVDAWIIAPSGTINTCTSFAHAATTSDGVSSSGNNCTQQLVFNGPVIAKDVKLQRSYGADPTISRRGTFGTASQKQTPAEVFNLRGDTYLWAYAQAARYHSSYNEVYSRELAPRY